MCHPTRERPLSGYVDALAGVEPAWTALQAAASPLGHSALLATQDSNLEKGINSPLCCLLHQ